jgi:hypothetical protein
VRYHQTYPSDDFKFIFKEKVNASTVESKIDHKEEIMRRMSEFSIIKHDVGGVNDNCIFELLEKVESTEPVLKFKEICPSGYTFLQKHKDVLGEYLPFWKFTEGSELNMGSIFKEVSPVFSK